MKWKSVGGVGFDIFREGMFYFEVEGYELEVEWVWYGWCVICPFVHNNYNTMQRTLML